jgi:uncharacterized protein (DUF1697 family)
MPRYVALLRAINVGGRTVKMAELCALFERARFADVTSVITSGNVLFSSRSADAAALETRIESALRTGLGYDVATFVRTADELDAVVAHDPFDPSDPVLDSHTVHVIFTRAPIDRSRAERIVALGTGYDELHVFGREVFWRTRGRSSDSAIKPSAFARAFGDPWKMFKRGRDVQLARFHELLTAASNLPAHPIIDELRDVLADVERHA